MRTSDFDYALPPELIAQTPVEPRDHSRLLVVRRDNGAFAHRRFYDLPQELRSGDLLVFNDSRVIPARIYGRKADTGGAVELLLLRPVEPGVWEALAKPGRRLQPGHKLLLGVDRVRGEPVEPRRTVTVEVVGKGALGTRLVRFPAGVSLEGLGQVPLPPYIREPLRDPERYQTVYARVQGSAAAPTAGLHFTPALLQTLGEMGVLFAFLTLHVGLDTFRPVQEEDPRSHELHREFGVLPVETAQAVNEAKGEGRRVVCVGTTTARLLEHAARPVRGSPGPQPATNVPFVLSLSKDDRDVVQPFEGWVDLMVLPGHRFRAIDALITNFHLPRSSLLMLVSAFAGRGDEGRRLLLRAYVEAVRERYRFYSFGDCMMIL